jgi:glutathione S-transferase
LTKYYDGAMPALRHGSEAYVESGTIADYLTFFFPDEGLSLEAGEHYDSASQAAKDFFPNLANYIKKVEDDESELSDLKASLSALDSHLASTGTSYLTSDELSTLDLSLAPQLHHMAVALDAYKPTSYPASSAFEEFKEVKKYVDVITKERAFLSAKDYEDEVVVWGWGEARGERK